MNSRIKISQMLQGYPKVPRKAELGHETSDKKRQASERVIKS